MIIVISKIQVRRGLESELPGTPTSISPPSFNASLDAGEIAFTNDSGRMFVGPDQSVGNPNFQRTTFPYQNIEILTEVSPANQNLFNQFISSQDRNSFFVPTIIPQGSSNVPLTYAAYQGAVPVPTQFFGSTISATVEYHAFDTSTNPVQQGLVRVLGDQSGTQIVATDVVGSGLTFTISDYDTTHGCYNLLVSNTSPTDVAIIVRIVSVVGFNGPYS